MAPRLLLAGLSLALGGACVTAPAPGPDGGDDAGADGGLVPDAASSLDACQVAQASTDPEAGYLSLLGCLRDTKATPAGQRAAIDAFVRLVDSGAGFPIVTADHVIFFYVASAQYDVPVEKRGDTAFFADRRLAPIRVAGDFNAWSSAPLTAEAQGVFHASLALGVGAQRWRYKLVAKDSGGGDVWFSDPLSRRFDFDANGRISLVRGGLDRGHLEQVRSVHATQLGNDRSLYLYLPRGYDLSTKRYPVLYMHDGQNLFDADQPGSAPTSWDVDAVVEQEVNAGRVSELVVVGIPNTAGRMDEYTQTTDVVGGQTVGGKADAYADFVVREVKPLVDLRYRTLADRAHTGLLGSSLGGLISYYLGLKHPETFRYVGGMSSTFDWGYGTSGSTVPKLWEALGSVASRDQVFYLDSGGGPGPSGTCPVDGPNDGNDNYCETLTMRSTLVTLGAATFPDDPNAAPLTPADIDIYHWVESGAPHTEASWNARMFRPLRLFFRP